jgi:hypothetical protein
VSSEDAALVNMMMVYRTERWDLALYRLRGINVFICGAGFIPKYCGCRFIAIFLDDPNSSLYRESPVRRAAALIMACLVGGVLALLIMTCTVFSDHVVQRLNGRVLGQNGVLLQGINDGGARKVLPIQLRFLPAVSWCQSAINE